MLARPALKMLYEVAGRRLLIDAEDDWSARAVSSLFAGWFLTLLSANGTPPDAIIRIRCGSTPPHVPEGLVRFEISHGGTCHTDGEIFYLELDGSLIVIGPGSAPHAGVWVKQRYDFSSGILAQVISQAFSGVLRRCGLFELHSGGVVAPGRDKAALITGASGSGKSTLTLQLAACGWSYLSDDTLLLEETSQGIAASGLRRFFALRADTIAATQFAGEPRIAKLNLLKQRVATEDLFPAGQILSAGPGAIFFPIITHEAESRVRSLSASETMTRLLRLCPWASYDKPTAGRHLNVLGRLAGEAVGFDILAGRDLLEAPTRTEELLVECLRGIQ